ncbi:glycosyltransferase [Nocardioides aequoreus]|uniref:glycosyltransferase n=1 Tax=Nocardioides aequoreus TaxID=397278 RepID=UPI001B806944|nr:glycosyltransferase [Nocardioides aequoreus]
MSAHPQAMHVVVPCRDESDALPGHLASLARAVELALGALPGTEVTATLVLDGCVDDSAAVVATWAQPWLEVLEVAHGCVGATRAAGVRQARQRGAASPEQTWLAHTDADTEVPPDWLLHHAAACRDGLDLWLGTVRPDADPDLTRRWLALHTLRDDHPHVHGANLGVRLSAYDAAGGFAPLPVGEDVALVHEVRRTGGRVGAHDRAPVRTSGRLVGRAAGGFATFLAAL